VRVFLSHGAEEQPIGPQLVEALTRSGLEIRDPRWLAAAAGQGPLAVDLLVLACDYVVALVLPRTAADRVVTEAIEVALRRGFGNGRLLVMAMRAPVSAEEAARRLIAAVMERTAQPQAHGRLPIVARTLREVEAVADLGAHPPARVEAVIAALRAAEAGCRAMTYREVEAALEHAKALLAALVPHLRPYYLAIARCICELHAGRDAAAMARLDELAGHPHCEASWFAAMSVLAMRAGRGEEARQHIRQAVAECRARGTSGLEVLANLGRRADPDETGAPLDPGLRYARAARDLLAGRPELTVLLLHGLPITDHDERSILLLARAYGMLDSWSAAATCLEAFIAGAPAPVDPAVAQQLARCHQAARAGDRARPGGLAS
jgi:hypothetical protein